MDPTWEETSSVEGRSPASTSAVPPKWEDTKAAPVEVPKWEETSDLQAQYGTPMQTAIAGAEAFGRGVLGPVIPGLERLAGVSPEGMRLREEASPWVAGGLEAAGLVAPAIATAGLSVEARAALEALTLPGLLTKVGKVGELAPTGLKTATRLGTELAAYQASAELTKAIQEDPNQTAGSALVNVGLSGLLGGAVGVPLGAASTAWEKMSGPAAQKILDKVKMHWGMGNPLDKEPEIVSPLVKRALSIFGGVPPEMMEKYAAQREMVMAAPEFHQVYGEALDHILGMQENLEVKKGALKVAQSEFKEFLAQQKTALKQAGYDAASADKIAQQALKEATTRVGIGLQNEALEAAPRAFSAVEKLRTQALEMSQAARDILDQTPGELSLRPVFEAIRPMQDELYAKGFPAMAEELGKTMEVFATQYGERIGYSDAKSMIQGLQQRGKWNMQANEVSAGLRSYYNQLSGIMNEALKEAVPAYRVAMKPTAEAFELLGKLDKYGSPEQANKAVLGLKNAANYANEMPMLRSLEAKTGINFSHQLEQYANPAVREAMSKAIPEYGQALKTAEALQHLKDPETRAALERAPYLSQAAKALTRAESDLQFALEKKAEMAGLSHRTLESKMKSVMAGRSLNDRKILEQIPGLDGMTIPEILDLINIRQAFEKGAMNGSRNVNLLSKLMGSIGAIIGGGVGGLTGGLVGGAPLATLGSGAGALMGAAVDKEGPAMVRALLDKYLDRFGDMPKVFGTGADQIRAALIHFIDSAAPADSKVFRATIKAIEASKSGGKIIKGAAKGIFEGGKVIPNHIWSDMDRVKKLDERTKKLKVDESGLFNESGAANHYLPDRGSVLSSNIARAVTYINANRPAPTKMAPLDPEVPPSQESMHMFYRGLQIAEQPLSILQRVADSTLLPADVAHLNAMYPEFYQIMRHEVMDAMNERVSEGKPIPYSLRQSLSLFMGETLDSSLAPENLIAAQSVFAAQRQVNNSQGNANGNPNAKKNTLGKMADGHKTAEQNDSQRRVANKV